MSDASRPFFRSCPCCDQPSGTSRRGFLTQAIGAGLTAAATLSPRPSKAKSDPGHIDVHHHFAPAFHREALGALRDGPWPKWSPAMSIEDMDKNGTATAVLSIIQPGTWVGDIEGTRTLTRKLNDYGATLVSDHRGRFAQFTCLYPPDIEGSLKEIEYGLDTQKSQGICLLTSYGTKYLGDPAFAPIYDELNRRKALIYVHPTTPACCGKLVPGIPAGSIEYATDTTRTIASLVFSGTTVRYPNIRWIFSHSGGTLPFLTARFVRQAEVQKPAFLPNGPLPEFAKLYYELAQGNTPGQIAALLKMVSVDKVLYGTDFPFRGGAEVNEGIAAYGFDPEALRSIERETALGLLPRLKT